MKAAMERHGERFKTRVFTDREIRYAESKANRYERFAARFAAKEAGMKALGTGWRGGLGWRDPGRSDPGVSTEARSEVFRGQR